MAAGEKEVKKIWKTNVKEIAMTFKGLKLRIYSSIKMRRPLF